MKSKKVIFFIGDIIVFYAGLLGALGIRYQSLLSQDIIRQHLLPFSAVLILWLIIFYATDRYAFFRTTSVAFVKGTLTAAGLNLVAAFAFFYILRPGIAPRGNLVLIFLITSLLHFFWYALFFRIIQGKIFRKNLLIVGNTPETGVLISSLESHPQLGYHCAGVVVPATSPVPNAIHRFDPSYSLTALIRDEQIKTIVLAENPAPESQFAKELFQALQSEVAILSLPHFYELVTGKIPVKSIREAWFFEHLSYTQDASYELIKRCIDITGAVVGSILVLAFVPCIAAAIALDSGRPIFFTQTRTGKNGRPFRGIKFRSMRIDAEKNGPQWAQKNDSRVTHIGKILRKFRIDEIPQLVNILKGDLSFVGPRPERPEFVEHLKVAIPFYNERHLVKPGLTGWAQINFPYGASEEDALEKLQYDLFYIKNKSLVLDLLILLKTVKTVLSGGGSEGRK